MTVEQRHDGAHRPSDDFDVDDPAHTRFDLIREGARRDGVEIVHYAPVANTRVVRRATRTIAFLFALSGLLAFAFVVAYIWWPWKYEAGNVASKFFTPVLAITLGGSLLVLGFAIILWAKRLLPDEIAVQERHDGATSRDEQQLTGAVLLNMLDETGLKRRPLLKAALLLPAGGLGLAAAAPLIGGLLKNPNENHPLLHTGWSPLNNDGHKVRLVRDDGTPIKPEDVSVGGQMTVFPGIPGGATNEWADSPTLLIHLRDADADALRASIAGTVATAKAGGDVEKPVVEGMWSNFVAYSKICTHAGCPASLYEQQTNRLLCPCHQSQFLITEQARPIFGPAHRKLPMLPIELDGDGYLVARSDYLEPVGPTYWERPDEVNPEEKP
jgi:ubiquinol-cytochrome c reductase iron-sulfur subunit